MPFHRGTWLNHPATGLPGIWIELSTDPPGTLTGLAQTAFPAVVTTGPVANRDTIATYTAKCNTALRDLCRKSVGGTMAQIVNVTITFSSISPVTISDVEISEGDLISVRVG